MSSHVVVQIAAVFAAVTMVRRRVPGMAGPLVGVATLGQGRGQAQAMASANSSLPWRIWSDSRSKDARRVLLSDQDVVDVNCVRYARPASQSGGMPGVNL
jgi:hypothetical protein